MPWQNGVVIPGFGTISRVVGIAAFLLGVLAVLDSGQLRFPELAHVLIALFVIWVGLTYFWSFSPWRTGVAIITYLQLLAMVCLVWQFAQTYREQVLLLRAVVLGTYVSCIATVVEYFQGTYVYYHRYSGAGFNPDELGLILAMSIPVSLYLILRERGKWIVLLYVGQLVLAVSTILLTASRGPVLACLGTLLFVPFVIRHLTSGQKALGAAFMILGGFVAFLLVPATSWTRLSTIGSELRAGTLNERTMIWQTGWQVFGESPFRGIGAGAFAPAIQHALGMPFLGPPNEGPSSEEVQHDPELVAHNSFISVLVEEGVIGFVLFLAVLLVIIRCAFRLPQLEKMFWLSFFMTWILGVSTLTYEDRKLPWLLFAILIGQAASQIPSFTRLGKPGATIRRRVGPGYPTAVPARGSAVRRWS
jgi:O-antigen ligase